MNDCGIKKKPLLKKVLITIGITMFVLLCFFYIAARILFPSSFIKNKPFSNRTLDEGFTFQKICFLLKEYEHSVTLPENAGLSDPFAILNVNGNLLVSDTGNNRLVLYDTDGNVIKTVGKKGTGKGEFKTPRGMTLDKSGNVYVVDAGNDRVQIFDGELNYIRQVKLKSSIAKRNLGAASYIALDSKDNIYLSANYLVLFAIKEEKSVPTYKLIFLSKDGKIQKEIGEYMNGPLANTPDQSRAVFMEGYEICSLSERLNSLTLKNGEAYFYNINGGKFLDKNEIPYHYAADGIYIGEDYIYTVSSCYPTIDRFSFEGEYKGTLYIKSGTDRIFSFRALTLDSDSNIYALNKENNKIEKFVKAPAEGEE